MADAAIDIGANLVQIGLGTRGRHQEVVHVFSAVVEIAGALHSGAAVAAHVDLGAGQCGRAARRGGEFEQGDRCSGIRRFNGGAGPGATEANDRDVGFHIPLADFAQSARASRLQFALFGLGLFRQRLFRHRSGPCRVVHGKEPVYPAVTGQAMRCGQVC